MKSMAEKESLAAGKVLKNRRLSKGLSLEAVAAAIKIKPKFISALEEERFNDLPDVATGKGFLKIYADYLGLDYNSLFKEVKLGNSQYTVFPVSVSDSNSGLRKWVFYSALGIIGFLLLLSFFFRL